MKKNLLNSTKIYLEIKDIRGGLFCSILREGVTTCCYSINKARSFNSINEAKKFINENGLSSQFKPIKIEN